MIEDLSVRGHVDDFIVIPFSFQFLDHPEDGLDHHHHSGVPSVAVVVHGLSGTETVFAEIVDVYLDNALGNGPSDYGMAERTFKKFRDDGEYVDSHDG